MTMLKFETDPEGGGEGENSDSILENRDKYNKG